MRSHRKLVLASFLLLTVTSVQHSDAITNIRYETWSVGSVSIARDTTDPPDSVTFVGIGFDAKATAADQDPAHGLRFAIAERDPGGNDVLLRFEIQPCAALPAPGSDITVGANFSVYCDRDGNLHAAPRVEWLVNWCEYPQARKCGIEVQTATDRPAVSEPEAFELVVLDENEVEGPNPTPEDALHVRTGSVEPGQQFSAPDFPRSGTIGIFADPAGVVCVDHIQPNVPFRWYVVARLEGLLRCGITTVEFGIHGLPANFFMNYTPNPDAIGSFGDPFTSGGIAFDCELGTDDTVVLYTLDGITPASVSDLVLRVEAGSPPTNAMTPWLWAESCPSIQQIGHARRQMGEVDFTVNPTSPNACEGTVAAQPTTWGRFKALYQDPR